MKKIETRCGYIAYITSRREVMRLGRLGICDDCGKMQISGYLVPVLNHFMCQKCYDNFDNHSTYYSSDADVEKKVAKYYEHVILSDNDTDEDIIESYSKEQSEKGCYICPRCGGKDMYTNPAKNASSRYADIYVCSQCGMEEALSSFGMAEKLPLGEWFVVKQKRERVV